MLQTGYINETKPLRSWCPVLMATVVSPMAIKHVSTSKAHISMELSLLLLAGYQMPKQGIGALYDCSCISHNRHWIEDFGVRNVYISKLPEIGQPLIMPPPLDIKMSSMFKMLLENDSKTQLIKNLFTFELPREDIQFV